MNDTIEAIRAKFAPASSKPATRVERELASERLSLKNLTRRALHGPAPRPLVIDNEERELRDREREARLAYDEAVAVEAVADRDFRRVREDGQSLVSKILAPGAFERAERHQQRCHHARLLAESEYREVLLALNACRRRREARRREAAFAEIAERDRARAARRRADGLPPLSAGEVFTIDRGAFRKQVS